MAQRRGLRLLFGCTKTEAASYVSTKSWHRGDPTSDLSPLSEAGE